RELEWQERQCRDRCVRQKVLEDDLPVGKTQGTRRANILEISATQEFGTNETDERCPAEDHQDAEQRPESRHEQRRQDQQYEQFRYGVPDFKQALEDEIDLAAEVTLHR